MAGLPTGCGRAGQPTARVATKPTHHPELAARSALAQAIRMAGEKDYVGFAGRFVLPTEREAAVRAGRTLDDLGRERLGESSGLVGRIRQVQSAEPRFSPDGQTVTYARGDVRVTLVKVDRHWYFA